MTKRTNTQRKDKGHEKQERIKFENEKISQLLSIIVFTFLFAVYCLISTIVTFELTSYLNKYKTTMTFYQFMTDLSYHVPGPMA
jgi:hypothetical protein